MKKTRVNLTVTPLKPTTSIRAGWLWDVTAEESLSGMHHSVGRIDCASHAASPRAKDLTARLRPDFTVVATIVEPNPDELGS